jgi:hypothetical protein
MRNLNDAELIDMTASILYHLSLSMDDDAAIEIANSVDSNGVMFINEVIHDVQTTSDWENSGHFNDSDVRLSIGRVMAARLGAKN